MFMDCKTFTITYFGNICHTVCLFMIFLCDKSWITSWGFGLLFIILSDRERYRFRPGKLIERNRYLSTFIVDTAELFAFDMTHFIRCLLTFPLLILRFLAIIRLSCNWMLGVPCSDLICGWLKMIARLARCNFTHHQLWFLEDSVFVRSMYNFLKVRFYLEVKLLRRWSSGFFSCTFI